jgi:uncharacterized phage infection (PIP) family protein YhgE
MSERRARWVWIFIVLRLLPNVAALGGVAALASSSSAADWIGPKLHLATRAAVEDAQSAAEEAQSAAEEAQSAAEEAQSAADDAASTADEAQSAMSSLCDEFGNYSGAFEEIYFAAC